jgi:hypothetical protein
MLLAVTGVADAEAPSHVFDATRSLTGGCTVSTADPVPDAGCPGGAHPAKAFSNPDAVATDSYGNIYVASFGKESAGGTEGRIDVFDSEGFYISNSSIADPDGPLAIAVDSVGNLYVVNRKSEGRRIVRYEPTSYEPGAGEIAYNPTPVVIVAEAAAGARLGIAVNPANDHVFVNFGFHITEFGTAAEDNKVLDETIGEGVMGTANSLGLTIDAAHNRIYANDTDQASHTNLIQVFELEAPHDLLMTIEGSATPAGKWESELSLAADEGTGHFFVFDMASANVVYEFDSSGKYLTSIEHAFQYIIGAEIAVDNGKYSPNGALNPFGHYLYVPSFPTGVGHLFAFGPPTECEPQVQAPTTDQLTQSEARLQAEVNPCQLETTYIFQYTTRARFEAEGFTSAQSAGAGTLAPAGTYSEVSTTVTGLSPDTDYVFRVVATNKMGSAEIGASFTTFPGEPAGGACPNQALRTGASALLPDCRAYELVTPPDTNAHPTRGLGYAGPSFAMREASPSGDKVTFQIEGGLIPGSNGTGALFGDPYLATRGPSGWSTANAGPDATESGALEPGGTSPDQGYSFWGTGGIEGTAVVDGQTTQYVRYPDGHSELVGRGTLAADPQARGKLISETGTHIVFVSANFPVSGQPYHQALKLEPDAPPTGTQAVYDRTSDGVTHVVSLLPGDKTPAEGENAEYVGASLDGRGIAFEIEGTLYLRYDNEETYEIGTGVTFAGIAEGGSRIFYVEGGRLLRFDASNDGVKAFNATGTVVPVNVSADGGAAYFVSTVVLTKEANPNGSRAIIGQQNLYLSQEGAISFVGTVTERDVEGNILSNFPVEGLGLWTDVVGSGELAADPSRSTADGGVLLFESRANLTAYDSEGRNQVYRYDSSGGDLTCLSCNPVGAAPSGDASLESISQGLGSSAPFGSFVYVANLRSDGRRALFQSTEALLPTDTDGLQDVYEWEAEGIGSCSQPAGCLAIISSGHSAKPDYLYATSDSGDDVFFVSSDVLLGVDSGETSSIYDARVNGGFGEAVGSGCQGEGCRPTLAAPPALSTPGMATMGKSGNIARRCPRGKRKVRGHGEVRCVRKKGSRKHHHKKAGSRQEGSGK